MSPDEARTQAKALLQSTDALLGGLLAIATQLREAVAVFSATIDQTEPVRPQLAREEGTETETTHNGFLTLAELTDRLKVAGIDYDKKTVNAYACQGVIPFIRQGKHRVFDWEQVLEALSKSKRRKHNEVVRTQTEVD